MVLFERRCCLHRAGRCNDPAQWIIVLVCIELMWNAAKLNFIRVLAVWPESRGPDRHDGRLFSIAIAAAEAAVGLALVMAIHRHHRTANIDEAAALKG